MLCPLSSKPRLGLVALALLLPPGRSPAGEADASWWSLRPLVRPQVPALDSDAARVARTPIDAFVFSRLREEGLRWSPEANRRTLIRRLYFDVIGLPPAPEEVDAFVRDPDPLAYERLVDRLLGSVHHGERWARHWLDVVHYGDTHGYDKDKLRSNAWPYRDYVIRAFNEDRPYRRFVCEQLAGDVLYPGSPDGIVATGFIAAGPWDFIGHAEVPATKIDGKIARNLDRDDMVATTTTAFLSTTANCARCHDHKFDPVTQKDYYRLQAVFAALDRADRSYDPDPQVARRRAELDRRRHELESRRSRLERSVRDAAGESLSHLEREIAKLESQQPRGRRPEFGYHSTIESRPDHVKWVQVDLGRTVALDRVVIAGCHDDFNNIGAGFGFPLRFKIELCDDDAFETGVATVVDRSAADQPNPGTRPQSFEARGCRGRYVRVTATRLAPRRNDYIFALAELLALDARGENAAAGKPVRALDSIEAPPRWARRNLVDGYYVGVAGDSPVSGTLLELRERRDALLEGATTDRLREDLRTTGEALAACLRDIEALPPRASVYAGTVYSGSGAFRGTGHEGGRPREIRVLNRGDVRKPGELVGPGTLRVIPGHSGRFELGDSDAEGERRRALAAWIVRDDNPLTWRSIVNRIWQYHFGRGIVDSPNDFGRMGQTPSHPELLDWLAAEFRDGGGSMKALHRLILTSAVYRQRSDGNADCERIDGENRWLWRMNRRRLEAEAIRDSALAVSGALDRRMYGPGFRCFVLERPEHSPHYEYRKHDPGDPEILRRSVYRFIVRSQPDPFMQALDCADPSQLVARRSETLTSLQALTLLNSPFMLRTCERFARRLEAGAGDSASRVELAFRLALGRSADPGEARELTSFVERFGLASACRLILNLNEFVFVD